MAYRRRQGISRASTFKEEIRHPQPPDDFNINHINNNSSSSTSSASSSSSSSSPSSSLAAQAIRASSAHRDSSLSSAYGESAFASPYRDPERNKSFPASRLRDSTSHEYTSLKSLNESKYGFWGVLARKAKSILEDENAAQQFDRPSNTRPQMLDTAGDEFPQSYSPESGRKTDSPSLQKGLDAITSSLNYIGGTIGKSFEEGLTMVEHRTADIIQETRRLQIRKKGINFEPRTQVTDFSMQTDQETQLKASRDVAMAMAAKAKLLLRELKTVKADLAFAKERCSQLEDENRVLRDRRDKGGGPEDDDLIRLQLETLLAEKARLAHENSIYARENRFLREIVEYHQLTMQDVVYLDEGIEEVTEVCPFSLPAATNTCSTPTTPPPPPPPPPPPESPTVVKDIPTDPTLPVSPAVKDVSVSPTSPVKSVVVEEICADPKPQEVNSVVAPDAVESSSSSSSIVPTSAGESQNGSKILECD